MKLGGLVVVASNAGGAWTPIGDITTTMLYIGGQVGGLILGDLFGLGWKPYLANGGFLG